MYVMCVSANRFVNFESFDSNGKFASIFVIKKKQQRQYIDIKNKIIW